MTPVSRLWPALLAGAALAAVPIGAQAASKGAPAADHVVTIQQMRFGPIPTGLHVGDTVNWVNDDIFVHSATAKDGSFDIVLKPKTHVTMRLRRPGTVDFYCRFHPGMTGVLVVGKGR